MLVFQPDAAQRALAAALGLLPHLLSWRLTGPFPPAELPYRFTTNLSELVDGAAMPAPRTLAARPGTTELEVAFPGAINEPLLGDFFGGAGLAWRAVLTTDISLANDATLAFRVEGARRMFVDGTPVAGDPYRDDRYRDGFAGFPVRLRAGVHAVRIEVGGSGNATTRVLFSVAVAEQHDMVDVRARDAIVPDIVDGRLASTLFSVPVLSLVQDRAATVSYCWTVVDAGDDDASSKKTVCGGDGGADVLQLGQVTPNVVRLDAWRDHDFRACSSPLVDSADPAQQPHVTLHVLVDGAEAASASFPMRCRRFATDPYRFTFLDADGSVQLAAVYPPKRACEASTGCPIIFTTHGAGVQADGDAWTYSYKQQERAYILLPTNRRRFGFDWETTGLRNALTSIDVFARDLPGVPADKRGTHKADFFKRIYAGHSMGGHGCWIMSTHFPDYALASVPASGWSRHGLYLPEYLRLEHTYLDAFSMGLLRASLQEYDVNMYLSNLVGVPALFRTGSVDDVVPPYLTRQMARMFAELGGNVTVSEIPGEGHWFDGVVDDSLVIQPFFDHHISMINDTTALHARLPAEFTLQTLNVNLFGTRGGVRVVQQELPHRLSRVRVSRGSNDRVWTLRTRNVQRLCVDRELLRSVVLPEPRSLLVVDGREFTIAAGDALELCVHKYATWQRVKSRYAGLENQRKPESYGPVRQVFETKPVVLVYQTGSDEAEIRALAVYISQRTYIQGRARMRIIAESELGAQLDPGVNYIFLGVVKPGSRFLGEMNIRARALAGLVRFSENGFTLGGGKFFTDGGIMYLAPTNDLGGLAVVLAGADLAWLRRVAEYLPLLSATLHGDYVVIGGPRTAAGGEVVGFGFWGNRWQFDERIGWLDDGI